MNYAVNELRTMPADSVAMLTPPLGRWYGGAVYRFNAEQGVWIKVADFPEDQLSAPQQLMLERTRARQEAP